MSEVLRAVEPLTVEDVVVRTAHQGVDAYVGAGLLGREEREARLAEELAPGATRPVGAGERLRPEEPDPYRLCFERDLDRIKHSRPWRRLAGKCQVFIAPEDDHLRTRLTHAVEVAQAATGIARAANLCVPLTESIALAHDCGHGPAGHPSEDAFSPYLPQTGYDHAVYGADVTLAELNLCRETLDGVRNHSWRRPPPDTPEGEVVAWADRIAYVCHDFEDAVRAGILEPDDLPAAVRDVVGTRRSEQIGTLVLAVLDAIDRTGRVGMTEPAAGALAEFRAFNFERIYLRPAARRQAEKVIRLLRGLVDHFSDAPHRIPDAARSGMVPIAGSDAAAAAAVHYVSGMTDRFALGLGVELLGWRPEDLRAASDHDVASTPMGILDEDVARVRESTDIVALIGEHLALKRVGARYRGLCPFHQEKTPSFYVNPELGVFHCLAGETRVITWEGTFPIEELSGTTQRVLTEKGRWVDAPFRSFGTQRLWRVRVGRNRVEKDIYATPEHRWFVRNDRGNRREAKTWELKPGDALSWSFPTSRKHFGVRPSPFGIAHGIVFGDGTRAGKGSVVNLVGEKNAELLKWFPWNYTTDSEYQSRNAVPVEVTRVCDLPAYFKDRPSIDESPSYLLGWLSGYFAADGCVAKDGTVILNSANREDLEFVRLICTRLGIGTYGITEQRRRGFEDREESSLFRIHMINDDLFEDFFLLREHRFRFAGTESRRHRRGWLVRSVEETERIEEVYCATVPGTHSFSLEDNILTGNCFGCQASGDAITFVREMEHLDFVDTVERLAARSGIQLRYDDKRTNQDRSRKTRLAEAVGAAIDEHHRLLLESPDAGLARKYLRSRGFDGDAVRRFKLGWAPDEWDHLSRVLQKAGYKREDLVESGLAFVNRVNKLQDQFRKRLLFPIYNARGEPAGFGGRALDGDGPKYKNSPENPLYHKSQMLYGLNWAKADIVAQGQVIVCEGYTDVMGFALAGAPNAVATCGTALTDDHVRALKNLARRVVLAYDADAAGQGAAEKWYGWEAEYDIELRVAALPPGKDPADLFHESPEALLRAVEDATPFLQFRIDRLLSSSDLSTPEGRGKAGQAAARIVAQHPNELVRDQYVMQLAAPLGIEADALRGTVAGALGARGSGGRGVPAREETRRRPEPPPDDDLADAPRVRPSRPIDRRELDLLRWAIHEPELVADWLDVGLFADPSARAVYVLLAQSATFREALDASEGEVRDVLERLAVEEPMADGEPETIAARLLVNAVEPRGGELLQRLLDDGDDRASEVKRSLDELAHGREVGDWVSAETAARRLVGWVVL